jgi:hypothetical protein
MTLFVTPQTTKTGTKPQFDRFFGFSVPSYEVRQETLSSMRTRQAEESRPQPPGAHPQPMIYRLCFLA